MADITELSSKGQVIIPKALRDARHWEVGQELIAIDTGDGILLKPKRPFEPTTLDQVAGCLSYQGPPKSLEVLEGAGVGLQASPHGSKLHSCARLTHPALRVPLRGREVSQILLRF